MSRKRTWPDDTPGERRVGILTGGRQDWAILLPVVEALEAAAGLVPVILATGLHFRSGGSVSKLDGHVVTAALPILPSDDTPVAIARALGRFGDALAPVLAGQELDCLILVGDRSETLSAGLCALCLRIPIVHLHGGETSLGAIDDACRHALSQLASLHCVSHPNHAERLQAMGIDADRIHITGAPGLDRLFRRPCEPATVLAERLDWSALPQPLIAVTLHPTTLADSDPESDAQVLCAAMDQILDEHPAGVVVTASNHDAGGDRINAVLRAWCDADPERRRFVDALGPDAYFDLLAWSQVMLGNSSSGMIEAPALGLPVINVGDRQSGRTRGEQTVDVPFNQATIAAALRNALDFEQELPRRARACAFGEGRSGVAVAEAIGNFLAEQRTKRDRQPA